MQSDIVKRPPAEPVNRNSTRVANAPAVVESRSSASVVPHPDAKKEIQDVKRPTAKEGSQALPKDQPVIQTDKESEKSDQAKKPKSKSDKNTKAITADQKTAQIGMQANSTAPSSPLGAIIMAMVVCLLLIGLVIYLQLNKTTI